MRGMVLGIIALASWCHVALPADAQLLIDRLWIDLTPDGPGREDILLGNESTERYYVTLTASEVIDPGTENERRMEIADPEALGLLISPTRVILDPGVTRAVRIVSIANPPAKDRVYRVSIVPQVTDVDAPPPVAGETGVQIRLLMAYDVLVVARPADATATVAKTPKDGGYVLRNSGNTSVLLTDGQVCPAGRTANCTKLADARLHAGGEMHIDSDIPNADILYRRRILAKGDGEPVKY